MPIPSAQYVRMSTEHQQYSLENQMAAIQKYAASHDFYVTNTYSDAAKSGVMLKNRPGLRQLLQDVVGGETQYSAILVYDVSRWGRFQDSDESAYYEFLCKSSGVPVHYCAEPFTNDLALPNLIMKALKRTMAGEFSRELGVKVAAGKARISGLGFRVGGIPGYGLRRILVSGDGTQKQLLRDGEWKSVITDRVTIAPGPEDEVACVREIYHMLISEGRTTFAIAKELNRRGVKNGSAGWTHRAVNTILTHPKYAGFNVFGRSSERLGHRHANPKSQWLVVPGAFVSIVDQNMFLQAQAILASRTRNRPNVDILASLKTLLELNGKLSAKLINECPNTPGVAVYRKRFKTLNHAYQLVGYQCVNRFDLVAKRRKIKSLRDRLMSDIEAISSGNIAIMPSTGRRRSMLRMTHNDCMVSVMLARPVFPEGSVRQWRVDPVRRECNFVTLIARVDGTNEGFQDFFLLPRLSRYHQFNIKRNDRWLHGHGVIVVELSQLANLAKTMML